MRVFISHANDESPIAETIRDELQRWFGAQVEVFLARDISLGGNWLEQIKTELNKSDLILVVFSRYSKDRPWINIEAGYGVMAGKQVIPLCHPSLPKMDLPVIYGLLQAMGMTDAREVERLLDQIAKLTPAEKFLGNMEEAIVSWMENMKSAVLHSPKLHRPLDEPPFVWMIGSNRGLGAKQAGLNKRFVGFLAQAFAQRKIRVAFGRSGILDVLGEKITKERDQPDEVFGVDRATLSDFGNASAMLKDTDNPGPNPIVLLGSMRSKQGIRDVFVKCVGRLPDAAIVIGGSPQGRTREEVSRAKDAEIPVFPLHFTGGAAKEVETSLFASSLSEELARIQGATRDFAAIAQSLCDVLDKHASSRRHA